MDGLVAAAADHAIRTGQSWLNELKGGRTVGEPSTERCGEQPYSAFSIHLER